MVHGIFFHDYKIRIQEDGNGKNGNSINLLPYSLNTDYRIAIVLKAKGAKYYIQGGTYGTFGSDNWTLIYNSNYSSESNLKAGFAAGLAVGQTMTMDDVSVVDSGLTVIPTLAFQNVMVQKPTSNSETILVKTSTDIDVTIDYGLTTAYGSTTTSSNQTIHKVLISGLSPGTTYHYKVTAAETANPTNIISKTDSTFKTQLDVGNSFVFGVVGDMQSSDWDPVASKIQTLNPDILLSAGDNIMDQGTGDVSEVCTFRWQFDFFNFAQNLTNHIPFFPSIGNHDAACSSDILTIYSQEFVLPSDANSGKYYSFDYGDVHFVSLNSEYPALGTVNQTQRDWLDADLAATTKKWKVVVVHTPGKNPTGVSQMDSTSANALHTIYQNRGVQLVINGHSHIYHRWIKDGIFYVTNTTSASSLWPVFNDATGDAGSLGSSISTLGYLVGTVTSSQITISSYNSSGVLQDTFNVAPNNFEVSSPANNSYTANTSPTLAWNATTQTDAYAVPPLALSKYQLYVDGVLNRDSISTGATSTTPTSALSQGPHTWYVKAVNNASQSQQSTSIYTINVDSVGPTISAVSSGTPTSTGTTIAWTTNEDSSSKVDYGLTNSYGSSTTEADTSTRVTSHSVSLSGLTSCTTYHYRVRSIDVAANEKIDNDNTFITTGCSSSSSSNNSNVLTNNTTDAPKCSDQTPGAKAPWLYGAIAQDSESILLYFTEADNPVNKYVLEYGTKSGDYPYGVQDMGVNSRGQMTFLVKSLSPNTTYYFRVRGGNGCATGTWSNEISTKTKGLVSLNNLDIVSSELNTVKNEPTPTPSQTPSSNKETKTKEEPKPIAFNGYDVKIKVVDTAKKPVEDAIVTLHSNPQTTKTDKNGIALFHKVEKGEHQVLIAYNNFKGEQSINLTGDVKEFDLNIQVKPTNIFLTPQVMIFAGIMGLVIVGLIVLLIKAKRKEEKS